MKMLRVLFLFSITTFALAGCSTKDVGRIVAQCESEAYAQIGVQSDSTASTAYLANKHELVRVCLVKTGLKFKSNDWSRDVPTVSSFPSSDGFDRYVHTQMLLSKYWE